MRRLVAALAGGLLVLAACGDGGGNQDQAADMLIEGAEDEGIEIDEDCVRDKASQLSDEDAQKIIDAEDSDETPDLSPEGLALTAEVVSCVPRDAMIDQILGDLPEGIDGDCVRQALEGVDLSEFVANGEAPEEFISAMTECMGG